MKVLVTGCAGQVGKAVTAHLLARGFETRGVDTVASFDGCIDYRRCDLLAAEALVPHLDGMDAVLHLAAIPAPGRAPNARVFQVNTAATFNVFDACAQQGVGRVVVASSINAVGYFFATLPFELEYLPVDEEHPKLTSDAYSFSKQVTEEIGAYFWRRDGIANVCLRFGAGLRPLAEMKKNTAEALLSVRTLVERLSAAEPQVGAAEIRRMRHAYDAERRERRYERREKNRSSALAEDEQRLMTLRQNYFSFVALEDACRAMQKALTAQYDGSHPLLILDSNNTLMTDAARLARLLYPDVTVTTPLVGTQSLVDWRRAADLIGFETEISAAAFLDEPATR